MSRKPGKKIDTFAVRTAYQTVTVDLRCDTDTGMFYAEHNGVMHKNEDVKALREEIKQAIVAAADVEWTRYIVIDYEAELGERFRDGDYSYYGGSVDVAHDRPVEARIKQLRDPDYDPDYDDDESTKVVCGMKLSWFVCEYSAPLNVGGGRMVRLLRHVNEETMEVKQKIEQQRDDDLPSTAIPFSEARLAVLREIRDAFAKVDHQLIQLFRGSSEEVAARLELVPTGMQPLAALPMPEMPAPPPPKKRKGSR